MAFKKKFAPRRKFCRFCADKDLPLNYQTQMMKELEEKHGWKIDWKAKKFISGPLRPADVSFDPTNIPRKIRAKK